MSPINKKLPILIGVLLLFPLLVSLSSCESKKQSQAESRVATQLSGSAPAVDRKEESAPSSSPSDNAPQQLAEKPIDTPKGAVKVKLVLESKDNVDTVRAVASGAGGASFKYAWTKNGEPAGEADSISGFKRGDKIAVAITPFHDNAAGETKTMSIEIRNSPPKVVESRQAGFDGNVLTYQVKAIDPDGDEVVYSLADAPQGMSIDKTTGLITWRVGKDVSGKYPVKVKMSDGHGGETLYELNVDISEAKPLNKQK